MRNSTTQLPDSERGTTEATFFKGKRPWSKIKDRVLDQYLPRYVAKVATLQHPIILIDAFAGPGRFEDGSEGSPLLFCRVAEERAPGQCQAIFVNRSKEHHERLCQALAEFIRRGIAVPFFGTAEELLTRVRAVLQDHTVFLYLDPFGLKGCEFSVIEPFLQREKKYSTEIVINLSIPTMYRLAAGKAVAAGRTETPHIRRFHDRLTRVLGGHYWKKILLDAAKEPERKANEVMSLYREKIIGTEKKKTFTGSCPVQEREGAAIKYYITFYSRHPDAMLLMNDAMCTAYHERIHEAATDGTFFAGTDWRGTRDDRGIRKIILEAVTRKSMVRRIDLWLDIIQQNFMRFTASEYIKSVRKLVMEKRLDFKDVRGTGRLNDEARLFLVEHGGG